MSIRPTFKYSEAFKLQVVNEIESGRVSSIHAASVRYGIGGGETVKSWVRGYGRNHLIRKGNQSGDIKRARPDARAQASHLLH